MDASSHENNLGAITKRHHDININEVHPDIIQVEAEGERFFTHIDKDTFPGIRFFYNRGVFQTCS